MQGAIHRCFELKDSPCVAQRWWQHSQCSVVSLCRHCTCRSWLCPPASSPPQLAHLWWCRFLSQNTRMHNTQQRTLSQTCLSEQTTGWVKGPNWQCESLAASPGMGNHCSTVQAVLGSNHNLRGWDHSTLSSLHLLHKTLTRNKKTKTTLKCCYALHCNNNNVLSYVRLLQTGAHSPLQNKEPRQSGNFCERTHMHACLHACAHAPHTHKHCCKIQTTKTALASHYRTHQIQSYMPVLSCYKWFWAFLPLWTAICLHSVLYASLLFWFSHAQAPTMQMEDLQLSLFSLLWTGLTTAAHSPLISGTAEVFCFLKQS